MDFSLPAWIGALAGTIAAVAVCIPAVRALDRRMRAKSGPMRLGRREAFEEKLSVMRRLVLGAVIAILATLGYWLGSAIGGMRG